ncbi:hypothetical protein Tco_0291677 [Tanacetum coccineum]
MGATIGATMAQRKNGVVIVFRDLPVVGRVAVLCEQMGALGPLSPRVLASLLKTWNLEVLDMQHASGSETLLVFSRSEIGAYLVVISLQRLVTHYSEMLSLNVAMSGWELWELELGAEAWFFLSKSNARNIS